MILSHLTGLRALAILFIILFHLYSALFPNGFLGVEAFLVISGFLLFRSFKEQTPSFIEFLQKKIARILPPVCATVFLSLLAALFFIYDDSELLVAYRTAAQALLSKSNIFLSSANGYFSPETANNPFMHTWYISVMLQIYLLYILIAATLGKLSKRLTWAVFSMLGLSSLIYTYYLFYFASEQGSDAMYYSSMCRIWEAFSGAIILKLPCSCVCKPVREGLATISVLGIALLSLCPNPIPIPISEPMVVLCCIIYIAYAQDTMVQRILSAKVLLWVGKMSFSLYLIHYPIIVYFKNWNDGHLTVSAVIACLAMIAGLSILCYTFIETKKIKTWIALSGWGVVCAYTFLFTKAHGLRSCFQERLGTYPAYLEGVHSAANKYYQNLDLNEMTHSRGVLYRLGDHYEECPKQTLLHIGDETATPSYVVIGDSDAEHLFAGLDTICKEEHCAGIQLNSIIFPFWGRESGTEYIYRCGDKKLKCFLSWLKTHPEIQTVVIGQLWNYRFNGIWRFKDLQGNDVSGLEPTTEALRNFCLQIKASGRNVLLVAPMPKLKFERSAKERKVLAHKRLRSLKGEQPHYAAFSETHDEYRASNKEPLSVLSLMEQEGVCNVLYTEDAIFQDSDVFCAFNRNNQEQYLTDATHLTPTGSILLMKRLKGDVMRFIKTH